MRSCTAFPSPDGPGVSGRDPHRAEGSAGPAPWPWHVARRGGSGARPVRGTVYPSALGDNASSAWPDRSRERFVQAQLGRIVRGNGLSKLSLAGSFAGAVCPSSAWPDRSREGFLQGQLGRDRSREGFLQGQLGRDRSRERFVQGQLGRTLGEERIGLRDRGGEGVAGARRRWWPCGSGGETRRREAEADADADAEAEAQAEAEADADTEAEHRDHGLGAVQMTLRPAR